jgi:hypothetical protein
MAFVTTLAILAIVYFAVIKPNHNTANNTAKQGEKQVQQAVDNANKATKGAVPAGVTNLVDCLAKAGTDTGQIEACKAKFQ